MSTHESVYDELTIPELLVILKAETIKLRQGIEKMAEDLGDADQVVDMLLRLGRSNAELGLKRNLDIAEQGPLAELARLIGQQE